MPDDATAAEVIDKETLRQKYREERDKRLRPDGNAQYVRIADRFAHYLDDPYTPRVDRSAKTDHVTFAFIGGGFAGLVTGARLKQAGIEDVRIIEKAGDFGGTWYWNRYPGAQCDTASMIYMPLLEETGTGQVRNMRMPPEILAQCRRIAQHFGLYENALFHTAVEDLRYDETLGAWRIRTNRGDDFTAQYIGLGTGPLHVPKLPGVPGLESFAGHAFHTSRWDYAYTGGNPEGALMEKLSDKRVGVIGTGATAVQIVPHLARAAKELYVFQRTPSSVDVRNNIPIDPDWFASIATPGWQQRWMENFTENQALGNPKEDLVQDGWTDLSRRIRERILANPPERLTPQTLLEAYEEADNAKMEEIRKRAETIVQDRTTAQKLKAWYRQLCKRPCFHDQYLQAFNQPSVHLIDTDGKGVERITPKGVIVQGVEFEIDCLVYATGFEVGTPLAQRTGFDPIGRNGISLSQYWEKGMRSKHGVHVHGFPNMFLVQAAQGANLISNYPHNLWISARTIALIVKAARARNAQTVEVTPEAEEAWVKLILSGMGMVIGSQECTPGYYNNEAKSAAPKQQAILDIRPARLRTFAISRAGANAGDFEGLTFV